MKKLIYLFAVCLLSASAMAQKITNKDLQGNWTLSGFNQNGVAVDVTTGTVSVSEEMKTQISADMMSQIDESIKNVLEALRASNVTFTENNIKQNMGGKEKTGTYTLKESDGRQLMNALWSDNTKSETVVWIKDKQLYIFKYEQGQSAEFVFKKA